MTTSNLVMRLQKALARDPNVYRMTVDMEEGYTKLVLVAVADVEAVIKGFEHTCTTPELCGPNDGQTICPNCKVRELLDALKVKEQEIAVLVNDTVTLMQWCEALVDDKPLPNGEYPHHLVCSGNRREPVGSSGCSCKIGKRIKHLVASLAEAKKELYEAGELQDRIVKLLDDTTTVLKGKPAPLHLHSWADTPEVAARVMRTCEAKGLLEAADFIDGLSAWMREAGNLNPDDARDEAARAAHNAASTLRQRAAERVK